LSALRELWERLKGKGPAAVVALTLDLSEARDNKPFSLEAGGLIVEYCTGDLYCRVNGPNGDGINLRYVHRINAPFSSLFLTNSAQAGLTARLLLLPTGMDADCPVVAQSPSRTSLPVKPEREDLTSLGSVASPNAAGVQIIAGTAGQKIKVYDAGYEALADGEHYFYFGTDTTPTSTRFCVCKTKGVVRASFVQPRISGGGDSLYVYSSVAETNMPYDVGYVKE